MWAHTLDLEDKHFIVAIMNIFTDQRKTISSRVPTHWERQVGQSQGPILQDQGALGESLRNSAAGDGGYKQKELKNAQIAPAPS